MRNRVLLFSLLLSTNAFSEVNSAGIPVVPAAKAKANLEALPATAAGPALTPTQTSNKVHIKPGVNEIVTIAQTHLNRIVTPFYKPFVKTVSDATTEIDGSVVYFATATEAPVTLFVMEEGDQDSALSLTLIPKRIPPRELNLIVDNASVTAKRSFVAEKWEKSLPYVTVIETIFKDLALQKVPRGYQFITAPVGSLPQCRQAGLEFDFTKGQTVSGHSLEVSIGTATNTSSSTIEFIEDLCGDWDIAAVSAYPLIVLNPGDETEVYVARKKNYREEVTVKRPSLISGAH